MEQKKLLKRKWNIQKRKFHLKHKNITKYKIHKTNTNYIEKLRCNKCGKTITANIHSNKTPYKLSDKTPECKTKKQKQKNTIKQNKTKH